MNKHFAGEMGEKEKLEIEEEKKQLIKHFIHYLMIHPSEAKLNNYTS